MHQKLGAKGQVVNGAGILTNHKHMGISLLKRLQNVVKCPLYNCFEMFQLVPHYQAFSSYLHLFINEEVSGNRC